MSIKLLDFLERAALIAIAIVLLAASILKFFSLAGGHIRGVNPVFPISNFWFWTAAASAEILIASFLFTSKSRPLSHFTVLATASLFTLYRIFAGFAEPTRACGCLGHWKDSLPFVQMLENQSWLFVAFMFMVALSGLFGNRLDHMWIAPRKA